MSDCPAEFVTLAERLADAARPVITRYFRTPVAIDDKADDSPVTIADREVESAMRAILAATVSGHGILGEEHGRINCDAEWVWVLDPIDGTMSFITGVPVFGTLISLFHHGRPVLGIIDQAILNERWLGVAGRPTTLNGRPVNVRACPDLGSAYAFTTSPDLFGPDTRPGWNKVAAAVKRTRFGADCYAYALLATGFADVVVEAGLKPYDFGALVPVITGAGGVMTDWAGQPLTIASEGKVCAAGDARLHAQALGLLA
ncbi:histidinol phosphate phosphatase [Paramagnetospirillum marisnigri]|uniref:Histidinol-phosphatase n=1 Tax=Paramagnetospirillum marisnigri TaxID=1285242 RepID=A0A178MPX2_9PROT|nr:histidinol-phosphatase [Paramagnetospirillum marisnigri]OAN50125.1 histidinol phosphate phosphatase [Paramagnetospirillum marisnigri]